MSAESSCSGSSGSAATVLYPDANETYDSWLAAHQLSGEVPKWS